MGATSPLPKRPGLRRPRRRRTKVRDGDYASLLMSALEHRERPAKVITAPPVRAWRRQPETESKAAQAAMIRVKILRLSQAELGTLIGCTQRQVMTMERGTMPDGSEIDEGRWRRYGMAMMAVLVGVGGDFGAWTYNPPDHLTFDVVQRPSGQMVVTAYPLDDPGSRVTFLMRSPWPSR